MGNLISCSPVQDATSVFFKTLDDFARVEVPQVNNNTLLEVFHHFDLDVDDILSPEELIHLLEDFLSTQELIEEKYKKKKQNLREKQRFPAFELQDLLVFVCDFEDKDELKESMVAINPVLSLALEILFYSTTKGVNKKRFLDRGVEVLFGAHQLDPEEVEKELQARTTKGNETTPKNRFVSFAEEVIQKDEENKENSKRKSKLKAFRTDGNLHRKQTTQHLASEKKENEQKIGILLYPNGTFCEVYSNSLDSWVLAVVVNAQHDGLVQVRYGYSSRWVRTTDENAFHAIESHVNIAEGQGELIKLHFGEEKFTDTVDISINDEIINKEVKDVTVIQTENKITFEENLVEDLYPNGDLCQIFWSSERGYSWQTGVIIGATDVNNVCVRYGNKKVYVDAENTEKFKFIGPYEVVSNSTIYAIGSFCQIFSTTSEKWMPGTILSALNDDVLLVKYSNHLKWVHTDNPKNFRMLLDDVLTMVGPGSLKEIHHKRQFVEVNLGWGTAFSPIKQVRFIPMDTRNCRIMFTQTQVKAILIVKVVQAFELPHTPLKKPTTYANIGIYDDVDDEMIFQSTHVVEKDPNPVYDDLLKFPAQRFDVDENYFGKITLYNYFMDRPDQILASAEFPLPSKFDSPENHVLTMENYGESYGVVVLTACLIVAGHSQFAMNEIIDSMKGKFAKATTEHGIVMNIDENTVSKAIMPISPRGQEKRSPRKSRDTHLLEDEEPSDPHQKRSPHGTFTVSTYAKSNDDGH